MPTLNPSFVFDLERRMQIVSAAEYQRLLSEQWFRSVAKEHPSTGKSERFLFLQDLVKFDYVDRLGGQVEFQDLAIVTTEFTNKAATAGLKLNRFQFEDLDGGGVNIAADWARQQGSYAAYWPQKQVAAALNAGATAGNTTYDSQIFFSGAHPLNVYDSTLGTFANRFKTSGGVTGPGAVPIDSSVTLDVAFDNLRKAIAYIEAIKMPNGEDPRYLSVGAIVVPPALMVRAQQLTNAKFIAQQSTGGAGSGDIEAVVRNWGLGQPVLAREIGAANTNGSDTTYYLVAKQAAADPLGALLYINREPFSVVYHNEITSSELSRMNELQWVTRGRNVVGYGHPYLIFRCEAA